MIEVPSNPPPPPPPTAAVALPVVSAESTVIDSGTERGVYAGMPGVAMAPFLSPTLDPGASACPVPATLARALASNMTLRTLSCSLGTDKDEGSL